MLEMRCSDFRVLIGGQGKHSESGGGRLSLGEAMAFGKAHWPW